MKRLFGSVVDGLHYLLSGDQEEGTSFKEKQRAVLIGCVVIVFCVVMLKLFLD